MDRRRMDADGGRVLHRQRRTSKLAVVIAVQNVLVVACMAVTLYAFWDVQAGGVFVAAMAANNNHPTSRTQSAEQTSKDDVHIRFNPIADISGNVMVKFGEVYSSSMMSLADENRDKIHVNCTGPYLLYMYLCYKDMGGKDASGTLQLLVAGTDDPVSNFTLNASRLVCKGLHSVAYLKDKDTVSLRLSSTDGFKIKNVTVGLSYLLGRCELF